MTKTNINGKIYLALTNHLDTMTAGYAVAHQGETFTPSVGSPYLIANDVRTDTPRAYIATDDPVKHTGFYMVDVMTPLNWTYPQMLGVVGRLVDRFSQDRSLTYDDVTVQVTDTPKPQGQAYRDGEFNRLPVKVMWAAWG